MRWKFFVMQGVKAKCSGIFSCCVAGQSNPEPYGQLLRLQPSGMKALKTEPERTRQELSRKVWPVVLFAFTQISPMFTPKHARRRLGSIPIRRQERAYFSPHTETCVVAFFFFRT